MPALTFRRFGDADQAVMFIQRLTELGFSPAHVVDAPVQDPLFVGNGATWHLIKLPQEEFDRAEAALLEQERAEGNELTEDHYLHGFTDEELMAILVRPDEWSPQDAVGAHQLLRQRGKPMASESINLMRQARIDDLREEAPPQTVWILLGYVSAVLGGLLGIAIGWYINTAKRTLPNGERIHVYRSLDRKHAARIVLIGVPVFIIAIGLRVWQAAQRWS